MTMKERLGASLHSVLMHFHVAVQTGIKSVIYCLFFTKTILHTKKGAKTIKKIKTQLALL
jgi:Na+/H+-translocating membrane pyrophosphatase